MKDKASQCDGTEEKKVFKVSSQDERWIKVFGTAEGEIGITGRRAIHGLEEFTSGYNSLMYNLDQTGWFLRECEIDVRGLILFYYHDLSPIPQTVKIQVAPLNDAIHDGKSRQMNVELYAPRDELNCPSRRGKNNHDTTYDKYKINFVRTKLPQPADANTSNGFSQHLEVKIKKHVSGRLKLVYTDECFL